MSHKTSLLRVAACALFCLSSPASGENWPQWRGPAGTSVSPETDLPLAWNAGRGILWQTPLPEWGNSTPCIWDDAIFLTAQEGDDLLLLRIGKADGQLVWKQTVGSASAERKTAKPDPDVPHGEQKFHDLHNLASPSPVTDGKTVVVHFGNGDLAAYDFEGKQLWRRNLQDDHGRYTIWWGHANSPVRFKNLVISVCMQDSLAGTAAGPVESYLVAHHLQTGRQRWKTLRMTGAQAEQCDSYTTPILHEQDGQSELIVMGGNQLDAYDPANGKQRWFLPGLIGGRTVTGPTIANSLIYTTQGQTGPLLAVKLGGAGELTKKDVAWKHEQGTPDTCCPVVWEDLLFAVTDRGIARCYDALTGQVRWTERLNGDYKASPLAADGRVYFLNTQGLCTVVAAAPRFERLTENQLDDDTLASPAVSDGRLFLRGRKALYCLAKD